MNNVEGVFCNSCGHKNPLGSNFCSSCGAVLNILPSDATVTSIPAEEMTEAGEEELSISVQELPEGMGILVVKRGPNAGTRYVLDAEVTRAGRHPDSEIFLDDITVSRRHAEFVREEGRYIVRDVGSLNGTYLNRQRVEEEELSNGDEVQVGKFKLVFLSVGER